MLLIFSQKILIYIFVHQSNTFTHQYTVTIVLDMSQFVELVNVSSNETSEAEAVK